MTIIFIVFSYLITREEMHVSDAIYVMHRKQSRNDVHLTTEKNIRIVNQKMINVQIFQK